MVDEVLEYGVASVALRPDNAANAASLLEKRADVRVVIGLPKGANTMAIKTAAAMTAIKNGAT